MSGPEPGPVRTTLLVCLRPLSTSTRLPDTRHNPIVAGNRKDASGRKVRELRYTRPRAKTRLPLWASVGNPTLPYFRLLAQVSAVTRPDERTNIEHIKTCKSDAQDATLPRAISILSPRISEKYISSA
ncbi:unnamed protein product [Lasius platythorax]|uniref:Uncharacterized protein n=1 Tax=Lasius platythorax TaxID=488582 RepID=A0AAV2NT68_9HYME